MANAAVSCDKALAIERSSPTDEAKPVTDVSVRTGIENESQNSTK